jgi:hypothetical protein
MNYAPTLASFLPRAFSPRESAAWQVPSLELPQVSPPAVQASPVQALPPLAEAYAARDAGPPEVLVSVPVRPALVEV